LEFHGISTTTIEKGDQGASVFNNLKRYFSGDQPFVQHVDIG